ncbi:hypothetical protein KDW_04830 [Dictyobacter vulcani]|uniref:Uncharacterized protein n=1 Tax=Dictyobacter vulcani TaxID=2607529 RepID=A0A5J4KJJ0_9CHLR|nr:hypothetical protein [Dictyobacter vulcani]GER86321.1 hypothetical protein KDW_04830 [Dictyobacter vulcani]
MLLHCLLQQVFFRLIPLSTREIRLSLDAYRQEWGGPSRAEATRRLLIEWNKLRQGQSTGAWIPTISSQQQAIKSHTKQDTSGMASTAKTSNPVARAASPCSFLSVYSTQSQVNVTSGTN